MNKQELISQAQGKGIPISERQLRRFIGLGIIVTTKRKGAGRAQGAELAEYHERSIETLNEMYLLSEVPHKDLIFNLYWRGFPVAPHKLKNAIEGYFNKIAMTYSLTAEVTMDPDNANYAITEMAREALPARRPGRPSIEQETIERQHLEQRQLFIASVINMIHDITSKNTISIELVARMFGFLGFPSSVVENNPSIIEWTNLHLLQTLVSKTDEQDFLDIQPIVTILRGYWEELKTLIGDPFQHPLARNVLEKISVYIPVGSPIMNMHGIILMILSVLVSNNKDELRHILELESTKHAFRDNCLQFVAMLTLLIKGGEQYE